ncbi:MAG: hypothetical protein JJ900_14925 [Rhodospirillales bacterium]|nr:hypothetical protein [Rhodospirillales bacterium]MBO6788139.1 hypothetical protein [Rhodospirillales bacterium]
MTLRLFFGVLCAAILLCGPAAASDRKMPDTIDPAKRYIFYLHGLYVERQGPYEAYHYYDILDDIEAEGFVVIGEARGLSNPGRYAKSLAAQVQTLLDAGVPSYHITVAGHSKGGLIALMASGILSRPGINYVVFAGCGRQGTEYRRGLGKFIRKDAATVDGVFLIAWAEDDNIAADCDDVMAVGKAKHTNKLLPAGQGGHRLFYEPKKLWLDLLFAHARGE